jgi:hypothetical protein
MKFGYIRPTRSDSAPKIGSDAAMPGCPSRLLCCGGALLALTLLAASPARADFFDDARRTITRDIPHFFQDDIPCTFGGQPTSGARRSCRNDPPPPRQPAAKAPSRPAPTPPRDDRQR